MVKKILMIVGDANEDLEVYVPYQILDMFGHTVHVVSPGKAVNSKVSLVIHDYESGQTYSEKLGHSFTINSDFETCNPETYDALFIPGGRGPEHLRMNPKVL